MVAPAPDFAVSRKLPRWVQKGRTQYHNRHGGPAEVAKNVLTQWSIVGLTSEELTRDGGLFSGGITPEVVSDWGMSYSEVFLDEMVALAKMQIQVNWSCGFSLEGEAIQRDIVTEFTRKAHRRGIHVCAYMSLTNIFWKEAFQREPQLEGYLAKYTDGSPHLYGNSQARYLACVNQSEWLEYLKKKMRMAIEDAEVDHVYFDNVFADCACDICVVGFADYTRHLTGEAIDLPEINPPSTKRLFLETNTDDQFSIADHDVRHRREYLHRRYLAWRLAEALRELRDYAFSLKSPLAFSANNHLYPLINDVANVLYSQDTRVPQPEWSNVPICRYLDADSDGWKPVVTNHQLGDADPRLSMAEAMAFQSYPYQITHRAYNLFYRDHPELFTEVESVSKIGVFLEWPRRRPYYLMPLGFANLMYEVILLDKWSHERLDLYDVILVPDLEAVSDELFEALQTYSGGRGTLICTGTSTLYDESGLRREQPMRIVGEMVGPNSRIDAQVLDLIRAASEPQPIQIEAPNNVVANLVRRVKGTEYLVHLVNYDDFPVGPIRVRVNIGDRVFTRAIAHSPDNPTLDIDIELIDGEFFSLDTLEVYSVVVLT